MIDQKFRRRFSMAHRLILGGDTKCGTPHGHNEFVTVTVRPRAAFRTGVNMSLDFGQAKGQWHQWIDNSVDHAFQLGHTDPLVDYFWDREPLKLHRLLITPGDPTTEMLALVMTRKFRALTLGQLELQTIEIEETPTNSVVINFPHDHLSEAAQGFLLAPVDHRFWWDRPDMSINDLSKLKTVDEATVHYPT